MNGNPRNPPAATTATQVAVAPAPVAAGQPAPPNPNPTVPFTPASFWQKVILAIILFVFAGVVVAVWFSTLNHVEDQLQKEHKIPWIAPSKLVLRPGPATFYYDRETNALFHRGAIDTKLKAELSALPLSKEVGNTEAAIQSYSEAISSLAYKSNESLRGILIYVLLLGGLSGLLGAHLRSVVNFVNVTCYKNELDVNHWWPWYGLRPIIGFVLGVMVVLMIKSELLQLEDKVPSGSMWWAAIAFLSGFGASEFTDRLRLLTQTLFGKSSPS